MPAKKRESQRRLSTAPLRDFIHVRDGLARELRAKGELEEARQVAALRKPPIGLWIANQLARLAPADVKALVEASARLRRAQSAGGASGEGLREAMHAQREALARLADAAGRAALEAGTKLTLELQRRVQNTVQAAAVTEPEALGDGSLEKELMPAGFGELLDSPPHASVKEPLPTAKKDDVAAARARKQEQAAAQAREKERARALHAAEEEVRHLEAAAGKLEENAASLVKKAAQAREQADAARRDAKAAAARALALRSPQK